MWQFDVGVFGRERAPAINDVFATALGGTCIGEMTNRVSHLFLDDSKRGMSRFVREALAFAVNPIQGFNRIVRGEAWRVRSSHNLYHDYQSVPVRFTLGVGTRYLADDGALFRGEMAPCLELGMEYGDAYNERTNRPYDYFTAHLDMASPLTNPPCRAHTSWAVSGQPPSMWADPWRHASAYSNISTISIQRR